MKNGVPGKGKILTQLSLFWFKFLESKGLGPHHLITADVKEMPAACLEYKEQIEGRSMLVQKLEVLPVEAIVRGYIVGSGWKDYQATGNVAMDLYVYMRGRGFLFIGSFTCHPQLSHHGYPHPLTPGICHDYDAPILL